MESGRWDRYRNEGILFHLKDRKGGEFALAPTAEEAVTDMVRRSVTSWRQLPFNLYQIRTKFRDEIRPRFGLLRGPRVPHEGRVLLRRRPEGSRRRTTGRWTRRTGAIFERCGLEYALVAGRLRRDRRLGVGGVHGRRRHGRGRARLLATRATTARTSRRRRRPAPRAVGGRRRRGRSARRTRRRRGSRRRKDQAKHLGTTPARIVNTMIYEAVGADGKSRLAAVLIRGDLEINEVKLPKAIGGASREAGFGGESCERSQGRVPASSGRSVFSHSQKIRSPLRRPFPRARRRTSGAARISTTSITLSVSIKRDVMSDPAYAGVVEVATARDGDPSPTRQAARCSIKRGIEVGHIFKLGTKYSEAMKCEVARPGAEDGPARHGLLRARPRPHVAAAIEQNHDDARHRLAGRRSRPYACVVAVARSATRTCSPAADKLYADARRRRASRSSTTTATSARA